MTFSGIAEFFLKKVARTFENRNAHVVPLQRRKGTEDAGLNGRRPKS